MRVIIFSDMEGASGITVREQVDSTAPLGPLYHEGRRLYTEDVNAAVRGAHAAGAGKIVIKEFHGGEGPFHVNHLIPEILDPHCEWIAHYVGKVGVIFEDGFDACVLVGFHAQAGVADGVMSHTITGAWRRVWLNDTLVGETALVAALVGYYGVPVVTVAGDTAVCREAKNLLGEELTTVAVKRGLSRESARIIPPLRARQMIEDGVRKSLQNLGKVKPYVPPRPTRFRLELANHEASAPLVGRAGVTVEDPFHIVVEGEDYIEAVHRLFGL